MKIIITSTGETTDSEIDPRFGRCQYFLEVDLEDGKIASEKAHKNPAIDQPHAAGIKAAQTVADLKPDAVITGNLGPNASEALKNMNIPAYSAEGSIKAAIESYTKGRLEKITQAGPAHASSN